MESFLAQASLLIAESAGKIRFGGKNSQISQKTSIWFSRLFLNIIPKTEWSTMLLQCPLRFAPSRVKSSWNQRVKKTQKVSPTTTWSLPKATEKDEKDWHQKRQRNEISTASVKLHGHVSSLILNYPRKSILEILFRRSCSCYHGVRRHAKEWMFTCSTSRSCRYEQHHIPCKNN